MDHHNSFLARDKAGPIGLLFLGDSITDFWLDKRWSDIYQQHYGAMHPADFGVSGDRTEHVLWRIANGELDGIHPKVVVLMIGTNNINDTAAHILAGDRAVVAAIHGRRTRYLDIGDKFLAADGTLPKDVMPDALHPNRKGYQIWADAMQPTLDEMTK